jgi:hypothetical protein
MGSKHARHAAARPRGVAGFRPDIALAFFRALEERHYDAAWEYVFRYENPLSGALRRFLPQSGPMAKIRSIWYLYGLYPNNIPGGLIDKPATSEELQTFRIELETIFGPIEKAELWESEGG